MIDFKFGEEVRNTEYLVVIINLVDMTEPRHESPMARSSVVGASDWCTERSDVVS